ncbi:prespore-specific regulator [Seinonella peptonophila]|uniref:Prespore-specific regulator n=1 Tax=Seinonella peptonophila TaxID=112248 RepID=A0A1M4V0I7_9BACL|nr:hypothetical protein [Seinonella peptonophila]SHE62412.1 prespore-specific regulator [Seinonella peptonophila]
MTAKRQDAWTEENDRILAEITLRHIREGGTQLSAFEEVAHRLGRTPAACGFRWNSAVRKQYGTQIQGAKQERQNRNRNRVSTSTYMPSSTNESFEGTADPVYSLDNIIRYLRHYKGELSQLRKTQKQLERELEQSEQTIQRLEMENVEMRSRMNHMQTDYRLVNDDYQALMQIMDRARKLAQQRPTFQENPKK